jgi:hypothetical protein
MAVGAILTWGVNASSSSINVDVVGVVLMIPMRLLSPGTSAEETSRSGRYAL